MNKTQGNARHTLLALAVSTISLLTLACSKSPETSPMTPSDSMKACGVERWSVKNLFDADVAAIDWSAQLSSIAIQDTNKEIAVSEFTPRLGFEKQTVSIPCTIVQFKLEDDSDVHLIMVDDQQDSMIGEIPSVSCAEVEASHYSAQFSGARSWLIAHLGKPTTSFKTVSVPATVTGVLFQDFDHGQKGHAKNYREIHPVTEIE